MDFNIGGANNTPGASAPQANGTPTGGWLMTAVAPWGESEEDAFDQCLVDLGLGDCRLVQIKGAMLPMGFEPVPPRLLPMGSLVECHLAVSRVIDGGQASAGVGWAIAETPEGDQCAVVATIACEEDSEETSILLKTELRKRMASRDLEVLDYEIAVDEVTSAAGHHGVVLAALILPDSLNFQPNGAMGHDTTRHGTARHGMAWHEMIWHDIEMISHYMM